MIIVAGGDSFIWGSEMADSPHAGPNGFSRNTFTALLAKEHEYVCAAYPGNSNSQIVQGVKTALAEIHDNVGVIVLWSWPIRDHKFNSDREIRDLQNFLDERNLPYMFVCADNCVVSGRLDYSKWFMFPPGVGANQTETPRGFYQWAVENKYQVGPQNHPLEQAHLDASKLMQEKFNELVKKHLQ
jgi:hypothetical protein